MFQKTRRCLGIALVATLAGCATARVSSTAYRKTGVARPVEILVDVRAEAFTDQTQASVAQAVKDSLQSDLIKDLTAAKIFAEPFGPATQHSGAAVLHVAITQATTGNALRRLVIGFGAGRAKLQAAADLRVGSEALVAFNTSSDSGKKPGLIVPGGVAVAAGDAVPLVIAGGIDMASGVRGALDRPVKATARTMVDQLKKYYQSVGWYWPTDQAQHS